MKELFEKTRKLREDIDWEEATDEWMTGQCIPFAVALSEIFPQYRIAAFGNNEEEFDDYGDGDSFFGFVHAFCYQPKNDRIIIDARGIRHIDKLYDEFYDEEDPDIDWEIKNSQQLIDEYAGKDFGEYESYEYDPEETERAKEWILQHRDRYEIKEN